MSEDPKNLSGATRKGEAANIRGIVVRGNFEMRMKPQSEIRIVSTLSRQQQKALVARVAKVDRKGAWLLKRQLKAQSSTVARQASRKLQDSVVRAARPGKPGTTRSGKPGPARAENVSREESLVYYYQITHISPRKHGSEGIRTNLSFGDPPRPSKDPEDLLARRPFVLAKGWVLGASFLALAALLWSDSAASSLILAVIASAVIALAARMVA